jgi:tetratricopeptide (TPR) repeat protein
LPEAIAAFERAIELEPEQPLPYYNRGRALAAAGRVEEAAASFSRHLELEPEHSCAVYDLARAMSEGGKHEEALEKFREYVVLEPEDPQGHCSLGIELMLTGKLDDAEAPMRAALGLHPWFDWAVGSLGSLAEFRGDYGLAEAFFREALLRDPELDGVRGRWIRMLGSKISTEAALTELRVNPLPSDAGNWASLMERLASDGKRDEAIFVGREMATRFADVFWVHGCFALCLADSGKPEDALAELREAVRLNPEDMVAHFHTGRILCDLGRFKAAVPVLEYVHSRAAGNPDTLRTLALAHAMLDETEKSREYARQVLELSPDDPFAKEVLGLNLPDEDRDAKA